MAGTVHVVGAGLAGLSAAVRLASTGTQVAVYEATGQPGGRCRSYHDQATGMVIDNGNHLLLSGNYSALSYLRTIGTEAGLAGPSSAEFHFIDLASRERWTLRFNDGRLPWWIFDAKRRVPGTRVANYAAVVPLLLRRQERSICDVVTCAGPLYERLLHPLLLAALNIAPRDGSAALAGAVIRETLVKGGAACRPLIARAGLGNVFIAPALHYLEERAVVVRLMHELRAMHFDRERVTALDFGGGTITVNSDDAVILAVTPSAAATLVPDLSTPSSYRAIVNAHFRIGPPGNFPPMIGVLNGIVEWVFAFPDRLAVTISNADRLLDTPREALAQRIWHDVSAILDATTELPPWQIVRERRATFAATPTENAKRPGAQTAWANLYLAGDWTATGLPATIESAIRSGHRAAEFASRG